MAGTTSKLRVAVIGVGVGHAHAKGYQSSPDTELIAVCDSDPIWLAHFDEEFSIPPTGLFTEYQKLLSDVQPDIVNVCLPNFLHSAITIAALEAGAHVICEKPMAIQVSDAERMIVAAEKADQKLAICYNHRYHADGL